jgi:pimeloyl-ACP methyl ester carboxylesterase
MIKKEDKTSHSLQIPKGILYTSRFLEAISTKLATLFAAKLFATPIKHKIPKREWNMNRNSIQSTIKIPKIGKEIVIYEYGKSSKKVLLVHGWSGRGTQLYKIADALIENGYSTISFDAPAHGKSKGNKTLMPEFMACILEIEKHFAPFEFAIGHSLGGMAILNALKQNFTINKAIIIGSGDVIQDIIDDFVKKIGLNHKIGIKLKEYYEKKYGEPMEDYGSSFVSKDISQPILIIHDKNDDDVDVKAAYQINKSLKNSQLMITEGLGHRKILGDKIVIENSIKFLKE